MKRYSDERKEAVLRKLAPPMNLTVPEVAEAEGISQASLYNWRKQARQRGEVLPSRGSAPDQWSSADKFRVVLETAPMNEAQFSAYCRERGLYPEQVEAWRESCVNANANAAEQDKRSRQGRKAERKRINKLEARAPPQGQGLGGDGDAADAVKKAEAIWGRNDEDELSASQIVETPLRWSMRPSARVPGWPRPVSCSA